MYRNREKLKLKFINNGRVVCVPTIITELCDAGIERVKNVVTDVRWSPLTVHTFF